MSTVKFITRRVQHASFEAFGPNATSANPIQRFKRPKDERAAGWLLAVVIGIALACLLAHYGAT